MIYRIHWLSLVSSEIKILSKMNNPIRVLLINCLHLLLEDKNSKQTSSGHRWPFNPTIAHAHPFRITSLLSLILTANSAHRIASSMIPNSARGDKKMITYCDPMQIVVSKLASAKTGSLNPTARSGPYSHLTKTYPAVSIYSFKGESLPYIKSTRGVAQRMAEAPKRANFPIQQLSAIADSM